METRRTDHRDEVDHRDTHRRVRFLDEATAARIAALVPDASKRIAIFAGHRRTEARVDVSRGISTPLRPS